MKKIFAVCVMSILSISLLPGCCGKKEDKIVKIEKVNKTVKQQNKKAKEIIEENLS